MRKRRLFTRHFLRRRAASGPLSRLRTTNSYCSISLKGVKKKRRMSSQYRLGECKRKRQNGLLGLFPHSLSCLPSVRGGPRGRVTEDTLPMAAFVAVYSLEAFFFDIISY